MSSAKLTKSAEKVLNYMENQQKKGNLTANHATLAKALNCCEKTIRNAIHQLEEQGYLSHISGKEEGKANTYFLAGTLEDVMKVTAKNAERIVYPLDKLNYKIWQGLESNTYSVKVEKQGSREEVLVTLAIRFHGEPLNAFDKRVYLAICALYDAGNEYMSAGMIYRTMGGNGYPSQKKFESIKQSIIKMAMVHISIDNEQEANKYNYPRFREIGENLLPCGYEQETEVKGGKSSYCLHLLSKPLLMRYAEEHKQLTTYTPEQFQCPLSITELNCAIDDYFRYRIARASGKTLKVLHTSLYQYCNISTRKERHDTRGKFTTFLEFYVKKGLIHGYSLETDAISINL